MANGYNWENTLRKHDQAIYDWLGNLRVDYGTVAGTARDNHPVLRVFAAPHRAVASAADLLVRQGWLAGGTDEYNRIIAEADWSVLPLPFATIDRDEPIFSPELAGAPLTIRNWFIDQTTGSYMQMPYPLHMLTTYRITFWSIKRYSHAHWLEWLYSQFGSRGAGNTEVFLTVHHDPPWGDLTQALRWVGTSDDSDLEGDNPRHIRSTVSLIFRTWLMRGTVDTIPTEPPVHTIQREAHNEDDGLLPTAAWSTSGNLFSTAGIGSPDMAGDWPKSGNATVTKTSEGLAGTVTAPGDEIGLATRPSALDYGSYHILSVGAHVTTTAPISVRIEHASGDPTALPAPIPVVDWTLAVPAGEHAFTEFALVAGDRWSAIVSGTGAAADVDLSSVVIRHVLAAAKRLPDTAAGSVYTWTGLPTVPHLVVVEMTTAGAGTMSVDSDAAGGTFNRTRPLFAAGPGSALVIQPDSTSLRLTVTSPGAVGAVYVIAFDAPYAGGSLSP